MSGLRKAVLGVCELHLGKNSIVGVQELQLENKVAKETKFLSLKYPRVKCLAAKLCVMCGVKG